MNFLPRPLGPGRPKDPEKRAAILEAAKDLFTTRGYDAVSMDAIAQAAGVSKLTVYSHFQDKETLFQEAVKAKCEEQLPHEIFVARSGSVREQILAIARAFVGLISSPEALALHRTMMAEARSPSPLSRLFYEAGPKRTLDELETFLRDRQAAGELDISDCHRAAGHFFNLLKGESHMRLLIGCCDSVSPEENEAHIASVVDLFLRAYAPRSERPA